MMHSAHSSSMSTHHRRIPLRRHRRLLVLASVVASFATALAPAAAAQPAGALNQLPGANACIENAGGSECAGNETAVGLDDGTASVVSPDGKSLYVLGYHGTLAEFAIGTDGALTQLASPNSCISPASGPAACAHAAGGLGSGETALVISPDGKNVYAAGSAGIAEFARGSDGSLSQLTGAGACLNEGGTCGGTSGTGLDNPYGIAISPDGQNVYVADGGNGSAADPDGAVVELARGAGGSLTELGCIADAGTDCSTPGVGIFVVDRVVVSPDGKNVYTATDNQPGSIAAFTRNADGTLTQLVGTEACTGERGVVPGPRDCPNATGLGIEDTYGLAISPDGHNVYAGDLNQPSAVAEFTRNADGSLTQMSPPNDCVEWSGAGHPFGCGSTAHGLFGTYTMAISPDGADVYLTEPAPRPGWPSAIVELARGTDGALTQLPSPNDCVEELSGSSASPDCGTTGAHGLLNVLGLAISPDGQDVYASSLHAVAEFGRVPPPPPPSQSSAPPPSSQPQPSQPQSPPAAKPAANKSKAKKHHRKKHKRHKKTVRPKQITRSAPAFTG
jgi:DNA-binding beta-propeller fold protein YncE